MTLIVALALVLTLLIELLVGLALAPSAMRRRVALDVTLVNLLTHPIAVLVHRIQGPGSFAAVELAVVIVESMVYLLVTRLPPVRALAIAIVGNAITMAISDLFIFG